MKKIFINHTNHPTAHWSDGQLSAARIYGELMDMAFPAVSASATAKEVRELVQKNLKKILELEPAIVLCQGEFNYTFAMVEQLKSLGVNNYIGFTAVFTHECAHRYFQNRLLPGPDFGQWEGELVADYFMGVRASLERMDITTVVNELAKQSTGSGTHPIGRLRWEYATYGKQEANFHLIHRNPFDIEEYFQYFLEYRLRHLDELRKVELKVY